MDPTSEELYESHVLRKAWAIIADGLRKANPDADIEFDTNDFYRHIRDGVDAKAKLAELSQVKRNGHG